jgi:hypothetical protein
LNLNVSGKAGNIVTLQPLNYNGLAADGAPRGASIAFNGYKTCVGDEVSLDYFSLGTITDSVPFLNINSKSYVRIEGLGPVLYNVQLLNITFLTMLLAYYPSVRKQQRCYGKQHLFNQRAEHL